MVKTMSASVPAFPLPVSLSRIHYLQHQISDNVTEETQSICNTYF